jgi:hypothetical protein
MQLRLNTKKKIKKKKEKQNPFKKAQYNSYFYDFSFYLIISYSFSQKNDSQQFFFSLLFLSLNKPQLTTNSIIIHVEKKAKLFF